ncbi:MAG: sigma-70 family RNA polymerase sigma factor [Planctomycetes bacterium]|nr:sigma-70 family RNA polymerase sigma factor [Planctomycetota bacterium]
MIRAREDRWFERFRRTGDPRLLAKAFDRTAPELWKVAAHLCRNRHAAEDAVQNTFLTAIEAKDRWDAARPLLPWLLGLLANRVRENRRRDARALESERVTVLAGERDPAELAEHGEFGAAFRTALQRLAEPFREALERHLVHGQAAHEIAAELGVPAGTVRMRLHRGLDQLRQKLPSGFVGGGLAVAALAPESFAAMRQAVLTAVPGGTAVAALGSGHVVLGVIGVLLMKKSILAVVAILGLGLGAWRLWPEFGGDLDAAASAPPLVAMTMRPIAPAPADEEATAPEIREQVVAAASARRTPMGRLRVVLRHGGTQEPVALNLEVTAGLGPDGAPRAAIPGALQFGTTDAQGVAVFTLPEGKAKVSSAILMHKKPVEAEVVANAETELLITLPVQLAAAVEVVDARGQAIAGARILGRTHSDVGQVVERELGHTGADGWWRAQFLDSGVPIRATANGFVASHPVDLHQRRPRARLVLDDGPALVAGTVFGPDGRPLPGAEIAIQPRMPGVAGERPMALVADAQGRYECAYVPPGAVTVFALRQLGGGELRFARADADVQGQQRHQVDVRFDAGARLVVSLTGADGRPVVGQEICASWRPEREVYRHFSAIARGRTDARGCCSFDGVMPGDYEVYGYGPSWRKMEQLVLVAGQETRCDWSLLPAVDVEVQVVDEARTPLAGWLVALHPGPGTVREADTDREGVVRFPQVADEAYEVSVHQRKGIVSSARTKVANGRRTVVVVGKAAMPTAAIHGAVQLPDGIALADVRAELGLFEAPNRGSMGRRLQAPDATFRFPNLPAGIYELSFRRENDGEYLTLPRRIDVAAAADVDTGTIALHMPTSLRIDFACADGGSVRDLLAGLAMAERPRHFGKLPCELDANRASVPSLPAGHFELLVWGADIAPLFLPIVVAGMPVQVSVTPQRAVPTTFQIVGLPAEPTMATLLFRQQGVELLSETLHKSVAPVRGFLPGSYRVEVETRDGWRGATDFTVGHAPGPVVEVRVAK